MGKKRILVIDDEKDFAKLVKLNLERTGLYEVVLAYNGEEGLAKVDQEDPDIVILDVMMPGKNGYEVLQELRRPGVKWRPVIMLTAKDDVVVKVYDLKADFYITKPFKTEVLLRGIEIMLALIPMRIREGENER